MSRATARTSEGDDDRAEPQRDRDDADHEERALRRHRESREQRIKKCASDAACRRRLRRRQAQREIRTAPPQGEHECVENAGDHRHVEPGDAHEMVHARAREGLPLFGRDRPLVAHDERRDDAAVRATGECVENARAHAFADRLHPVRRPVHERVEALRIRARPDVAVRAHAALEQPRFVIEAVWIGCAVRPLHAHGEPPPLTGMHVGQLTRAAPPRERDAPRHSGVLREHFFHVQIEPHAALVGLRKGRDDTDQLDVAAFPFERQRIGHAHVRESGRPEKPRGERRETDERRCSGAHAA